MKIDVTQLLSGKANKLDFDYLIPTDERTIAELALDGDAVLLLPPPDVTFTEPVRVTGTISNSSGSMELKACAEITYATDCARCIEPITGTFSLEFTRDAVAAGVLTNEDLEGYLIVDNGLLDIDEQLVEELLMEFPMRFLCSDSCKGICQKCGQNLNLADCGCASKKEIDPRLAILQKLLDNSEEL